MTLNYSLGVEGTGATIQLNGCIEKVGDKVKICECGHEEDNHEVAGPDYLRGCWDEVTFGEDSWECKCVEFKEVENGEK